MWKKIAIIVFENESICKSLVQDRVDNENLVPMIIKKFFQDVIIHDKGNQCMSYNAVWFLQILPNTYWYYQPDNFASPLGDGAPEGRGRAKG